ncbi:DEAD/DEAH box helicase [Planococcus sp. NCCP-2050]|uniref:DEAD/DEAH box helicase n=1 Tax=Planococcus sp. NCCP-2050 TaxID=2944679 RepID=UPI00203E5D51|nr:DEAD/DEAH box helicase [Planococcus sp. NCCP-2050]GKW47364.1 hypothetical protein NCCP2050_30560 [Planococcus sp. NCCP-2050]
MFAAQFFDSYINSNLDSDLDTYLLILGASSYYLCDLPGSSSVLAKKLSVHEIDLDCEGLDILLTGILKDTSYTDIDNTELYYKLEIKHIFSYLQSYYKYGVYEKELIEVTSLIQKKAYQRGSARELLFADIIYAIVIEKIKRSSRRCLNLYTGIPIAYWETYLKEEKIFKEFWPAQMLLGEKGVFSGNSAVIQLPTSAGKTKSIELIIRSAFAGNRTKLAIIVAPFKALCHEITDSLRFSFRDEEVVINELSDMLQEDFIFGELDDQNTILVTTPEKFIYILRHSQEIANEINLVVYDEGHQFDSGERGVKYELLITSLNQLIPETSQKILISAVIKNADSINVWLNGEKGIKVSGLNYSPTHRSIAFVDWRSENGQLKYINNENLDEEDFFVPRMIVKERLENKIKETSPRYLPKDKTDVNGIAVLLGLKAVKNGSVAIFAGTKVSVNTIYKKIIDAYERNLSVPPPLVYSDEQELEKMYILFKENLGEQANSTKCVGLGFLSHTGDVPMGMRAAVEYSMKEGLSKFIICTSTLAQGVNLPIKYLILTNLQQGINRIKVRDFHNLMGRAGRAGMHTEGNIIFANPSYYAERVRTLRSSKWTNIKRMLDPINSEEVESSLHKMFENITIERGERSETFYVMNEKYLMNLIKFPQETIMAAHEHNSLVAYKVKERIKIIETIESFVMSHWGNLGSGENLDFLNNIVQQSLAYSQATEERKKDILLLFKLITENIKENIGNDEDIEVIGKTLFGVKKAGIIYNWTDLNKDILIETLNIEELADLIWPLLVEVFTSEYIQDVNNIEMVKRAFFKWISGESYNSIYTTFIENQVLYKNKEFLITDVVELCDQVFSYQGALIISAIVEFINSDQIDLIEFLNYFQRRIKLGLPNETTISLYNLGFNDRVVVQEILPFINKDITLKMYVRIQLKSKEHEILEVLETKFPKYFSYVLKSL